MNFILPILMLLTANASFAQDSKKLEYSCASLPFSDPRFGTYYGEFDFLFDDNMMLMAAEGNTAGYPNEPLRGTIIDTVPVNPVRGRQVGGTWIYKLEEETRSSELRLDGGIVHTQTSSGSIKVFSRTYDTTTTYQLTCKLAGEE